MSKQSVSPLAATLTLLSVIKQRVHMIETKVIHKYTEASDEVTFTIDNELQCALRRMPDGLGVDIFDTYYDTAQQPLKAVWSPQELAELLLKAFSDDSVYELAAMLADKGYVPE